MLLNSFPMGQECKFGSKTGEGRLRLSCQRIKDLGATGSVCVCDEEPSVSTHRQIWHACYNKALVPKSQTCQQARAQKNAPPKDKIPAIRAALRKSSPCKGRCPQPFIPQEAFPRPELWNPADFYVNAISSLRQAPIQLPTTGLLAGKQPPVNLHPKRTQGS